MLGYTVYQGKETRERIVKEGKGTTFTTATATVLSKPPRCMATVSASIVNEFCRLQN